MSTTTLSSHKKPPHHHHRNNSDELGVFEASRYFSDYNDNNTLVNAKENNMLIKQQKQQGYYFRQGRASLDMPTSKQQQQEHYYKQLHQNYTITPLDHHRNRNHHNNHHQVPQLQVKELKKQPSSPGGKLAHFLNTLFNQKLMITSKNKKQPKSTQSMKKNEYEGHQNPNTRKQRRNSISHIYSSNSIVHPNSSGFPTVMQKKNSIDTNSLYSSSSSKSCQNKVTSISDYKQALANFSKYKVHDQSLYANPNPKNYDQNKKFNDDQVVVVVDNDDASDASSDLFELQIDSDYGFSSTGLPVYETTCMDNIKRPSSTLKPATVTY